MMPQVEFQIRANIKQSLNVLQDMHLAKRFYDMAAETSTDAYIPVSFALIKLTALFLVEYFKEVGLKILCLYRSIEISYNCFIYFCNFNCGCCMLSISAKE